MMPMIRSRTVVLIGSISLAAGWIGRGDDDARPARGARRATSKRTTPLGVSTTKAAPFTEQLRRKLDEQPRSPVPGRNPFVFGSRRPSVSAPLVARRGEGGGTGSAVRHPRRRRAFPAFKLSGIASSEKDGRSVLTAILIDNGSMVFAKAGDKLSGGHSVLRVEEKAIVIVDAAGVELIVRLP